MKRSEQQLAKKAAVKANDAKKKKQMLLRDKDGHAKVVITRTDLVAKPDDAPADEPKAIELKRNKAQVVQSLCPEWSQNDSRGCMVRFQQSVVRKKVADEVLQTEVNYVNSLDILVKVLLYACVKC